MYYHNLTPETAQAAIDKRNQLIADGAFSDPEGKLAVITSTVVSKSLMDAEKAFRHISESNTILDTLHSRGRWLLEVEDPTISDMEDVLTDTSIAELCVIGEGSLGNIYLAGSIDIPDSGEPFDWQAVSAAADHLKTGNIYQRMGSVAGMAPVVWGTFAAADLSNLWVSIDPRFEAMGTATNPEDALFNPYGTVSELTYDTLCALAIALQRRPGSRETVLLGRVE